MFHGVVLKLSFVHVQLSISPSACMLAIERLSSCSMPTRHIGARPLQPGARSIQDDIAAALDVSHFGAAGADSAAAPDPLRAMLSGADGAVPSARLPEDAQAALEGLLPTWRQAGGSQRRLTASPPPPEALKVGFSDKRLTYSEKHMVDYRRRTGRAAPEAADNVHGVMSWYARF